MRKNKRFESCAIKASSVAKLMSINESIFKKIKETVRGDFDRTADSVIGFYDLKTFWQKFINAFNQEGNDDLWDARVYQDNDSYDQTFVFCSPYYLNLFLVVSNSMDRLKVFYAYVDTEGGQEVMWHFSDYNRFEEELNFNCTYCCSIDTYLNFYEGSQYCHQKFNDFDIIKLIQFLKVFVDNVETVAPKHLSEFDGVFKKFMRKFGYSKKMFSVSIEGGFEGEVMNDAEWVYDAGEKLQRFYSSKGIGKKLNAIHSDLMDICKSKGRFFQLQDTMID